MSVVEQSDLSSSSEPPLAISVIAGGTIGTRAWRDAILPVARRLVAIRPEYSSPLAVLVVFEIPGEVIRPDFSGIRTGSFSRRKGKLVVQVAVPESVDCDRQDWAIAKLREAISLAEEFAVMEALPETDLSGLRRIVDALSVVSPE